MNKKKKEDDRRQLLIRYRIANGKVHFIDPCCDDIPAPLFVKVMKAFANIEKEWNNEIEVGDRVRVLDCPLIPEVVGKCGIVRHKQGDLYRIEVDGKMIPDYALESDIELLIK